MGWYKVELWGIPEPAPIDDKASKKYVYVRKDIHAEKIPVPNMEGEIEMLDGYVYYEQKIKKEDWELYQTVMQNTADISDADDALVELAELISELMEG